MSDEVDSNMPRKVRTRKLTPKDRIAIVDMYATGRYTYSELAERFKVHKTRIAHIINDTYGEMDAVQKSEGSKDEKN